MLTTLAVQLRNLVINISSISIRGTFSFWQKAEDEMRCEDITLGWTVCVDMLINTWH